MRCVLSTTQVMAVDCPTLLRSISNNRFIALSHEVDKSLCSSIALPEAVTAQFCAMRSLDSLLVGTDRAGMSLVTMWCTSMSACKGHLLLELTKLHVICQPSS